MFVASIQMTPPPGRTAFSLEEEARAIATAADVAHTVGFSRTKDSEILSEMPLTKEHPYRVVLTMTASSGESWIDLKGSIKFDHTELRFVLRDIENGAITPFTDRAIGAMQRALEREFPRYEIEVKDRRALRLFAP